jgi:carboxymethylenebutenolidase
LGIYGGDGLVPDDEIEKLRDATASADVAADLVHFPGSHRRFDTDQDVAAEAWTRTLNWFDSHLR